MISTMTSEESQQLAFVGTVLIQNISDLIFISALFGVYILAFTMSMHIILGKENDGWAHKVLIVLLLAGFAMSALFTYTNAAGNLILVKFALVKSLPGGLLAQEMTSNLKTMLIGILNECSENFTFLVADTAIVWRAWALWAESGLVKWTLLIILLADIGVNIADAIVAAKITNNFESVTLDWVTATINLTVNIVATLLIAYRAWTYYQSTHALSRNKTTQVEAILLLMIESGAIFGIVQVANVIFNALDIHAAQFSPVTKATTFLDAMYLYSAALNPVALLILIQTGNTYENSFHLEDAASPEINQS
ncbi:hypothetical protein BT96DRAFT_1017192 [Gymnopus androsaceus JB14]|uniref:Uncharacterized protein n=1 Tax=Gymnopus androsaceus JB14 TaxID=1447944 RepID=A0A6A4HZJ1_9AGAR|nr:hypothetical protein BT96DRAFT_1017192 [Gymnopus androsaceus JB14]